MSVFTPGQFKKSLQNKIKGEPVVPEIDEVLPMIKKTDPAVFTPRASDYYSSPQATDNRLQGAGTAVLPKESLLNKPVHERMKEFVKEQYGKSKTS